MRSRMHALVSFILGQNEHGPRSSMGWVRGRSNLTRLLRLPYPKDLTNPYQRCTTNDDYIVFSISLPKRHRFRWFTIFDPTIPTSMLTSTQFSLRITNPTDNKNSTKNQQTNPHDFLLNTLDSRSLRHTRTQKVSLETRIIFKGSEGWVYEYKRS